MKISKTIVAGIIAFILAFVLISPVISQNVYAKDIEILTGAKDKAILELETYVNLEDYKINANLLEQTLLDGKELINSAETIENVETALINTKKQIDSIESDLLLNEVLSFVEIAESSNSVSDLTLAKEKVESLKESEFKQSLIDRLKIVANQIKVGWHKEDNKWYYFDSNGSVIIEWLKLNGTWYYMDQNGVMQTGWIKVGSTWYYMKTSGAMQTGWLKSGNRWFYLNSSGSMHTGWAQINGTWYYMNTSGVMETGWTYLKEKWYYLKGSGAMAYNSWISGKYYVGSNGAMYVNSWTPDGYYVGNNGAWDSNKKREIIRKGNILIKNPESISVLVNKTYILPSSYVPSNLVVPNVSMSTAKQNNKLTKEAANALEKLFKSAGSNGYKLYARSGYRSYSTQKSIFERNVKRYGSVEKANRLSAKAGQSEHQTGLAMDITIKSINYNLSTSFANTAEGRWVSKNAHKYGFIIRYPKGKESITGYSYEPWHIRFMGEDLATKVYNSGLTYEEYLKK